MNSFNKKLLFFGGTFDPPHRGHKEMLEKAKQLVNPDLIIISPCFLQPLKTQKTASAEHRLNMTKILFPEPKYKISDYEIKKGGKSFTIETLKYLETLYTDYEIYILIGGDSYQSLEQWKNYTEILKNYYLVVVARQNELDTQKYPFAKSITFIKDFNDPASSTSIRDGNKNYLTEELLAYVKANALYSE